ncbi:MAG: hypothetical protein RL596_936 [Bacteroidota bacterium]|jgi:CubicO group peptidase (beta-lactamase class C family)
MIIRLVIYLLLSASTLYLTAQKFYFPDSIWQTKSASALKLNQTLLDSAVKLAIVNENKVDKDLRIAILKSYANEPDYKIIGPTKERGGPAGLIIKDGYIVAKWGDVNSVDMTFSVTKSFLSTTAGLAIDKGLIKNVNDRVTNYVWDESFKSTHNSKITWDHLLTQSSDWSGTLFGLHDWADRPPRTGTMDDWKKRPFNEPGNFYKYNDVRVNLLAYSLLQVWRKPLPVVLKEKIMDPIGASTTWRWYGYENSFVNIDGLMMQSVSGGGHHGGGLFINTTDMARFGLLFLRNGKWNSQQLVSEKWVNTVQQSSTANKEYGYLWWLNSTYKWKNVPSSVYYAAGYGGNYIVIDKTHDLLIVTRWIDDNKIGEVVGLVIQSINQ